MEPRISILLPVWNGEAFLAEAVDSLLAQTFQDFELLAVDDGSTDRTLEILRGYADPRLRIIQLDHGGIVLALNRGLAEARGAWIARMDADDISSPVRLEKQWRAVERRPDAILCHTDITPFGGEGMMPPREARRPRSRSFMALRLCYQCPIVHSTVLFKKAAVEAVGGYRPEERHAEDFALWGRLLERGGFLYVPEKLVKFRLHAQSVSQKNLELQQNLAREIGVRHCRQFLQLNEPDALRANAVLRQRNQRTWSEWRWFLFHGVRHLRWKSAETYSWLAWQTLKLALGIQE